MRVLAALPILLVMACNGGEVSSKEEARIAYLGIDTVITRALGLGFDGFNAADSANIPEQRADGAESGTIVVTGTVDQGVSANKGMQLDVALTDFTDGDIDDPETKDVEALDIVYATRSDAPLACEMKLRNIPNGTLEDGIFKGTVQMTGDLEGELELDLTFHGEIESDGSATGGTVRTPGSTEVTGTASSAAGDFQLDTTI